MKKPVLVANWKMNKTISESVAFGERLKALASARPGVELILAPSATALGPLAEALKGSPVSLAAQNIHWEDSGPYTGEVSAVQARDAGCAYALIGHSERRQHFGEGHEQVNRKTRAALRHGLRPLVCVGETLKERESNRTLEVLDEQLTKGLAGIPGEAFEKILIAYEPVWAIGTGRTVTNAQASEAHRFARRKIGDLCGRAAGESLRVLYGGSVHSENASALMAEPEVDGLLVGGASLDFQEFSLIFDCVRSGRN